MPLPALIRSLVYGVGVVLVQWLLLGRLRLWGAYPDAVLLFVAWLGLRYGRRAGSVAGFVCGFAIDVVYDTWGLHMLVKTAVGFMIGLFPSSEREGTLLLPRQALVGGLLLALVHNGLLVLLLSLQTGVRDSFLVFGLWIGSALYTAVLATAYTVARGR